MGTQTFRRGVPFWNYVIREVKNFDPPGGAMLKRGYSMGRKVSHA